MWVSAESEADISRIRGKRNRKLRISRHAWTARLPARGRRYRRRCSSGATWSAAAALEECTLRLRAADQPVRKQNEEETDHRLERARRGRHAHVSDRRERDVPDLLPRGRAVQASGLVVLGVDRDHPGQVDDAPEATVLPDRDESEDHRPVLR